MTDEETLCGFDTYQAARGFASRTVERRRTALRQLSAFLSPLPLLAATGPLIEEWIAGYHRAETKAAYLSDVRAFFRWAARRNITRADPTVELEAVRRPAPLPRPVRDEDLAVALLVADERLRLVILLGAFAGLRRAEIAHLRAEDCTEQRIVVRRGKGGRDRVVPTHPIVWRALCDHGVTGGWLLDNGHGGHVQPGTVGGWINSLFRELGIDATLHKTRHRFGTRLAEVTGGNMLAVRNALGHAHLTTSEHYVAFDTAGMAELINRLPVP